MVGRSLSGVSVATLGRALLLSAAGAGLLIAVQQHLYATSAFCILAILSLVLELIYSTRALDRGLSQFIQELVLQSGERPAVPSDLAWLRTAIERALDEIATARAQEQARTDFLQTLINSLSAAFFMVDSDNHVMPINRAAAAFHRGTQEDVDSEPAMSWTRLAQLPVGSRQVVALGSRGAMLVQVVGFSARGHFRRLLTLQSVGQDLDAVEVKAWQDVVRVLAHEMLNSLTPICSMSESIAQQLNAKAPLRRKSELVDAAQVISRRSRNLMRFVDEYRCVTDPPMLCRADVEAMELVRGIDRVAKAMLPKGVSYLSQVHPPALRFHADGALLEQALINLVKNGIEAVAERDGGEVRLTIEVEGDMLHLKVTDNGPGIRRDNAEEIFVPFFTTKPGGSGIGLTLARQIALAHGGRLEHRPQGGKTSFHMTIPLSAVTSEVIVRLEKAE